MWTNGTITYQYQLILIEVSLKAILVEEIKLFFIEESWS